mgnify:CR=1 FL=1
MTAALLAALHGLKVTLLEGSDQVGGTTATSAGSLWIPRSSQGAGAGHPDDLDSARRYLATYEGAIARHAYRHGRAGRETNDARV